MHLNILKWLHETGCPIPRNRQFFVNTAAYAGRLDILEWGLSIGCVTTCLAAVQRGNYDLGWWIRSHEAPWDICTVNVLILKENFKMLKEVIDRKCPYG